MRLAAAGALLAAALLVPAPGLASDEAPHVSIEFGDYAPAQIDVLARDTVTWTNDSVRNHTVTDDADAYDSGVIPSTYTFAHRFDAAGSFPYHCRLHPYIRGEVDVHELLLERPSVPAQANQPFPLYGRAALPSGSAVSIEADDGSGAGYQPAGSATVDADGHFVAVVKPATSALYRAVAGDETSPPVQVLVLNHTITARARRGRRSTIVSVLVTPAAPGSTVVLQLNLRERFGWWPVASARLDRRSRARFVLRLGRDVSSRARLTLPDGATALATSPLVRVGPPRRGRHRPNG
jgi:plastocyanin